MLTFKRFSTRISFLSIVVLLLVLPALPTQANTITVNANCTLAQAINEANGATTNVGSCAAGDDTANSSDTISVGANITVSAALPEISTEVIIQGVALGDGSSPTITASGVRLFVVGDGELTVNDLTVKDATITGNFNGGAITCYGSCTRIEVDNSTFENNRAPNGNGGAINMSVGALEVTSSTFEGNTAVGDGGAIHATGNGRVTITGTTFTSNSSQSGGGAIHATGNGQVTITNSTFNSNEGVNGGAIYFDQGGALSVASSHFTLNAAATNGGAIYANANLGTSVLIQTSGFLSNGADNDGGALYLAGGSPTIRNNTISANSANANGGGIFVTGANTNVTVLHSTVAENIGSDDGNAGTTGTSGVHRGGGFLVLRNSILAGGTGGNSCSGATGGTNNIVVSGCTTNLQNTRTLDPQLGTRVDVPPVHYPLLNTSPAIDAGHTTHCTTEDQIGPNRRSVTACDLGAFEYQGMPATAVPPTAVPATMVPATMVPATMVPATMAPGTMVPPTAVPTIDPGPGPGPDPAPGGGRGAAAGQRAAEAVEVEPTPVQTCAILMGETDITVTDLSGFGVGYQCNRADATAVGDARVIAMGLIDAVDVWDWIAVGVEVCFPQSGAAVFLDAAHAPRTLHTLESYTNDLGMTCATIDRAGTVALVEGSPTYDYDPSNQLSDCMVYTKYILNFRRTPGGEIKGLIPAFVTLTALAHTSGWYEVDYWGDVGWISADYVDPQGDCG